MNDQKAIEWLSAQLPGLVKEGVITPQSAEALRVHYGKAHDPARSQNLAVIVCAILGGTLIGAGMILLIAHNWQEMGRPVRTAISILPLLAACLVSGWAILRKPASMGLNEGGGVFHVLAIGSAISLVSQTYHISGNFSDFMLCWSLLALPLAYLLRSTLVAMLYLIGIAVWAACRVEDHAAMLGYWPLLAAVMPFYGMLLKENRVSLRANWLSAAIGLSVPVAAGFQCDDMLRETGFLLYSGLFVVLYLVERQWFRQEWTARRMAHPFRLIGAAGIVVMSIAMSYEGPWRSGYVYGGSHLDTEAVAFVLSFGFVAAALACYLLVRRNEETVILIVTNCYAAMLALGTIVRGFRHLRLGTLNAGMLIAAALIIARFFDSDLGFAVRGLAFIVVGSGFLAANWMLLRKRRKAQS